MDGGSYVSKASSERIPTVCSSKGAGHGGSLRSQGEVTTYGGIEVRLGCLTCYQGNWQRVMLLTAALISDHRGDTLI